MFVEIDVRQESTALSSSRLSRVVCCYLFSYFIRLCTLPHGSLVITTTDHMFDESVDRNAIQTWSGVWCNVDDGIIVFEGWPNTMENHRFSSIFSHSFTDCLINRFDGNKLVCYYLTRIGKKIKQTFDQYRRFRNLMCTLVTMEAKNWWRMESIVGWNRNWTQQ